MAQRTPEEIRASIEHNRQELGTSLIRLRSEVEQLTDWRAQLRRNQQQLNQVAAVSGFVLGGGIAALGGLAFGRGRRKKRR
jgi:C4-dicarboxylate-specific signal transduction histidine kinase